MQAISLWLAAAIVILTGWAIVKKYQVNMVLFIAGLLLNIIGVMNGATNFLPKNATATGLLGFDFFELFRAICRTQIAGVGFIILVSGGFAQYMKDVGASDRFVTVCAKPITLLKNPYLILGLVFIIGSLPRLGDYIGCRLGHAVDRDGLSADHPRRLLFSFCRCRGRQRPLRRLRSGLRRCCDGCRTGSP